MPEIFKYANTLFIIVITSIISVKAFDNYALFDKLKFNAYLVRHKKEWSRMFSNALVHGGWLHLILNMYVLYLFGSIVEQTFQNASLFPQTYKLGKFFYMLMYILAIPFSSIISLLKYKNYHSYNAVGASGAISAVVFAFILISPMQKLYILFIPVGLPGYIFGILYLAYSYYMSRKQADNIAHEAHFAGAIFGFIFPLILNHYLFYYFIYQIAY